MRELGVENQQITLIAGVILALLILAFLLKKLLSKSSGDSILIVGPSDSGKTTMFLRLSGISGRSLGTVASMQPNEGSIRLRSDKSSARPIKVVDIPGHPRLRGAFDKYASFARGIVFTIDSVDFMPKKTDVAEQLFDVLCHPVVAGRRLPILLACNKADAGPKAHTVDFIKKILEKEIDQLRVTRSALAGTPGDSLQKNNTSMDQQYSTGGDLVLGGSSNSSFTFARLATKGSVVSWSSVSAVDTGGVEGVEVFMRKCIPQ